MMTTPPVRTRTILVIDDEMPIRRAVGNALGPICDRVLEADTAAAGLDLAASASPELIVLDLGLPDGDGLRVCTEIRRWSAAPIVVLSARHDERHKVQLLTAGVDDYVTKPFSIAEFVARVQALLRRAAVAAPAAPPIIEADGLTIDIPRREVSRNGVVLRLTPTEFLLLQTLALNAGRTMTHQQIFDAVWKKAYGNAQQYLRVHITNLRRKVERTPAMPRLLVTDPGVGYRFEAVQDTDDIP